MPRQSCTFITPSTKFLALAGLMTLFAGCANTDRAVFVTKTSLSILDVDSTPPGVSIAYDRVEGFIGPAYKSGGVPPVVGFMKSDGKIINPHIRQVYATGNAARVVTGVTTDTTEDSLSGPDKQLMLYGTSTTIGLKFSIDASPTGYGIPNNFVFGYRRKEFSMLPLGLKDDGKTGTYPSVLATIDNQLDTNSKSGKLTTVQYFATGQAATALAGTDAVKKVFTEETDKALSEKAVDANIETQRASIARQYIAANTATKTQYDVTISADHGLGYSMFSDFLLDEGLDQTKLDKVVKDLKDAGLIN